MRRVFPPHAYGGAPRAACFWPTTVAPAEYAAAKGPTSCDVAVIGAGFTGLSAALHLAQAGEDVVVLEARQPGWGASGRNGGFCCLGGSADSDAGLRKRHGEEARREFRRAEAEAVAFTRGLIETQAIDCDIHSNGETLLAPSPQSMAGFAEKARQISRDHGVTARIIPKEELAQHGLRGPFHGAITTPIGFALNPMKYGLGLARSAAEAGARIHGASPVMAIARRAGYTLSTPEATVTARRLIVATNGYSADDLPGWLAGRYMPTQSNVVVTRPMRDDEIAAQGWSSHQMCYDDRFFLHYFRLMPDRRMLFGMRGGLYSSPASDRAMHRRIRRHFEAMFPAWRDVETPHSWNGLLSIARDLTPYAGPIPDMPGAFTAISFHGNGVAMGSYAGALLADQVLGRGDARLHPRIMKSPPRRFPFGRLRRVALWPLYAWAALRGA